MESMSWLCPTAADRERFLDMHQRLRLARVSTIVAGTVIAVALARSNTVGWWFVAVVVTMAVVVLGGARNLERRRRPELWVFVSAVMNIALTVTLAAVMTGGPRSNLSSLLAIPVLMVAARFSNRGIAVGAPISAGLILVVTVGVDPAYVATHPLSLLVPMTVVMSVVLYMGPLVEADVRHREASHLDQLTGLLNRRALEPRMQEIGAQAALTGRPVSVIAADIDHFKQINDAHGHALGDQVLRDVSLALRSALRSFELLYRTGGEEFLLLLPDSDGAAAVLVAERLRAAVAEVPFPGAPGAPGTPGTRLSCSFGVATARGREEALSTLLADADAALYEAKRRGRDRVVTYARPAPGYAGEATPSASRAAALPVSTAPSM
jgi:diguanylate cyclase (GGDEF)-like protein